ncbi:MAG: hypothetical protein ACTH2Q_10535 [Propionibacteriaceae bacterium]
MSITRRRLLGWSAAAGAGLVSGCSVPEFPPGGDPPENDARCVDRGTLDAHEVLGESTLVYEPNGRAERLFFEADFFARLEDWRGHFIATSGLPAPDAIANYGSWTAGDGNCSSWHNSGRAFDVARLTSGADTLASCRYDIWKDYSGDQLAFHRRRYWALAASLHHHFAYVLTHLFDDQHHNHIHVDNSRSGTDLSTPDTSSRVQAQAVQSISRHIWNVRCEITGEWDAQTREAGAVVLERIGVDGDVHDSAENWRAFLTASVTEGTRRA